jgi:hypothetical protein
VAGEGDEAEEALIGRAGERERDDAGDRKQRRRHEHRDDGAETGRGDDCGCPEPSRLRFSRSSLSVSDFVG